MLIYFQSIIWKKVMIVYIHPAFTDKICTYNIIISVTQGYIFNYRYRIIYIDVVSRYRKIYDIDMEKR
jgi:hypothetical protein